MFESVFLVTWCYILYWRNINRDSSHMRQDGYVRWIEKDHIPGSVFYSWNFFNINLLLNPYSMTYISILTKMGAGFSIILTANTRNIVWRIYPSYRVKGLTRVSNLGYIWDNRLCSKRFAIIHIHINYWSMIFYSFVGVW